MTTALGGWPRLPRLRRGDCYQRPEAPPPDDLPPPKPEEDLGEDDDRDDEEEKADDRDAELDAPRDEGSCRRGTRRVNDLWKSQFSQRSSTRMRPSLQVVACCSVTELELAVRASHCGQVA